MLERIQVKTDAALDQRWAKLDSRLGDVQRIAIGLAKGQSLKTTVIGGDTELIAFVMGTVVAELYQARSKRPSDEENPTL